MVDKRWRTPCLMTLPQVVNLLTVVGLIAIIERAPMNHAESSHSDAPLDPADIPLVLTQIARLADGVKSEFDLIGGRMTWLMISESFIFSAFVTAIASYRVDHPLRHSLLYLIWVLPVIGMVLTVCVYAAILAAHRAIAILKSQRDHMIEKLPSLLRIDLISNSSRAQWWGNLPTYLIPPLLFLTWAIGLALALV